jgi:predicted outer membrane repeat protein
MRNGMFSTRPLGLSGILVLLAFPLHAATFTVTSLSSSGPGSFLQAVIDAEALSIAEPAEIVFDETLFSIPRTIVITSTMPRADRGFVVQGPPLIDGRPAIVLTGDANNDGLPDADFIELEGQAGSAAWEFHRLAFSRFKNGPASSQGSVFTQIGAINASVLAQHCSFQKNESAVGGAVHLSNGVFTANDCMFLNNASAGNGGGAISCSTSASLLLNRCHFEGNSANDRGGAVRGINMVIEDCHFANNRTTVGLFGGGAVFHSGSAIFRSCAFSGNSAGEGHGGAVYCGGIGSAPVQPLFENCTFVGNRASKGGAIHANYADATLVHCTVVRNVANHLAEQVSFKGGGLSIGSGDQSGRFYQLHNTIVAENTIVDAPSDAERDLEGVAANYESLGGCLIGVGSALAAAFDGTNDLYGTSSEPIAADLGPLQYNGGHTPTCQPVPGSPAIHAGEGTPLATDQRGQARPAGPATDKGAVEFRILNFNQWAALHPLPENGTDFLDDPDRDGLANLLEYYTGSDPMRPSPPPVRSSMGASNLQVDYPVADHAATGSYSIVFSRSTDLENWQKSFPTPVELSRDGNTSRFRVNFAASTPSRFVRIGVVSEYVPQ